MSLIWLGVLMVIAGLVYMAAQAIWRGPLSGAGRGRAPMPDGTLEPPHRGLRMFGLARNWPGLAMIALGFVVMYVGTGTTIQ